MHGRQVISKGDGSTTWELVRAQMVYRCLKPLNKITKIKWSMKEINVEILDGIAEPSISTHDKWDPLKRKKPPFLNTTNRRCL
jgi:hypothetical protein